MRGADERFKSARHGYGLHSFHPLPNSKNGRRQGSGQDTVFPSEKTISFSCSHLVCDECLDRDGYQSHHTKYRYSMDTCCNQSCIQRKFSYNHGKYYA